MGKKAAREAKTTLWSIGMNDKSIEDEPDDEDQNIEDEHIDEEDVEI